MDLKSKNILLNREQTVAKIADVGLSRGTDAVSGDFVAGTLEYCAPEVLLGRSCNQKVMPQCLVPSFGTHDDASTVTAQFQAGQQLCQWFYEHLCLTHVQVKKELMGKFTN